MEDKYRPIQYKSLEERKTELINKMYQDALK